MKRLSVIIALGAIALMADGASAASRSHVRKMPQTPVNSFGYGQVQAIQGKPYNILEHPYESYSQGLQSYENPDRVTHTGEYP